MKATKKKRTIPYVQVRLKVDAEMGGIYDRMMRTSPRLRAREVIGMMRVADAVESPACGTMTWNRKHYPNQYRDERCSPCWFAESRRRLAALQAEENRKLADYDAKQKADGMTHKVTAVIHPKRGGDDHIIDIYYSAEPKKADVEKYLKRRSSVIDYKITVL